MAAPYALLNMTRPYELFTYSNNVTNSFFGMAVIGSFFFISLVVMKNYDSKTSFAASSFISMILGFFFMVLGIIPEWFMFALIIMTALGAISLSFERN